MANVNLKTDFKDGEFLYADQLKNNFKAIQAALDTMNAIVWQDNADKVVTFRGTTEELMNREIINGQILYDTNTGESYIDYLGRRISTGSGNAIHIGDTEPTNPSTQIWIKDDNLSAVGSEVVNSLEGNEERMAPSVDAVNKGLAAIIDSGSNENGEWIKWNDGTMICTKRLASRTTLSVWNSPIVFADISAGNFPQTFTAIKSMQATSENDQVTVHSVTDFTNTSAGSVRITGAATEAVTRDYIIHIFAIGKWK